MKKPYITNITVQKLIHQQFPEYSNLSIKSVPLMGNDNKTFRLGDDMLIRLPSALCYAEKVEKEQKYLPRLAQYLSFSIPKPIAMGVPSEYFPWNWSIYNWLPGSSANSLILEEVELEAIALDLAKFLNELHKIPIKDGLLPGTHNFFRGGNLLVYDKEARDAIKKLENIIDIDKSFSLWEKAISSKWNQDSVWIHGDVASGNILINDGRMNAVIDWGGMAIGDPACDLVIAWSFLKNKTKEIFKTNLNLGSDTWARARGWALWKACITLVKFQDKSSSDAIKQKEIIDEILDEHES